MATKGLKYPVYALYEDATGSAVYTGGKVLGKALTASASYTKNNIKLYADDAVAEMENGITGGTISIGVYNMALADRAKLLGHTVLAETAVGFKANVDDQAPYVGIGFYGAKTGGKYIAFWYPKVQFGEPNDELETKGETTAFKTPVLEGELIKDINGDIVEIQEFEDEEDAVGFLDGKIGKTGV